MLVELEDGRITNIGHVCGGTPKNFGDKFVAEKMRFSEDRIRRELSPRLQDRAAIKQLLESIGRIRSARDLWYPRLHNLKTMFSLDEVFRRNGVESSGRVIETIERSATEIERLVESGAARNSQEARYAQIDRGVVKGLYAFLNFLPIDDAHRKAEALHWMDPLTLDIGEMIRCTADLNALTDVVSAGERWISAVQGFLSPSNLSVLAFLLPVDQRSRILRITASDLDPIVTPAEKKMESTGSMSKAPARLGKRANRYRRIAEAQALAHKNVLVRGR
ncbi:MAG: hypothetical protein ACRYGG_22300 [Janthinobacterium lividum]